MLFSGLKTNLLVNPLSVGAAAPEFSWQQSVESTATRQVACELEVWRDSALAGELTWQSGLTKLNVLPAIRYSGKALEPFKRYYWRVRGVGDDGLTSQWSDPSFFETGGFSDDDWSAAWIGKEDFGANDESGVIYLRTSFKLSAPVVRARGYVSALGWYRFFVNGKNISGTALVPRWTPLDHEVEYQAYELDDEFTADLNVVSLAIGGGRYKGGIGLVGKKNTYGDTLAGFAQLHLELADGTTRIIATDERWSAGTGRIIASDPQAGEHVDLRISDDDWLCSDKAPARFSLAKALPRHSRALIGEDVERVEKVAQLAPAKIMRLDSGKQVIDFGQNFAGVIRIHLRGNRGTLVRLVHSEILKQNGEVDTAYLDVKAAKQLAQTEEIILDGNNQWFEPWFTIHGFRYVEVSGLDALLSPQDVVGVVKSTNLDVNGSFDCSDPRLNRFHQNVLWSMRSNFTDTTTDSPTRERSGWTGDTQIFAPTATLFADVQAYLRRYLHNLRIEQYPDGRVPHVIPSETSSFSGGPNWAFRLISAACGWSDACVLVAWSLYKSYGDVEILRLQYDSMKRWVDYMTVQAAKKRGHGRWLARHIGKQERFIFGSGFQFGEWCRPGARPRDHIMACLIPSASVATAYFRHSSRLLAEVAALLGFNADAERYGALTENVRAAWCKAFVHKDGRIGNDMQEDYLRALNFELIPHEQRAAAAQRLVELVEQADYHLSTGFLSTSMLLPTLVAHGRTDIAYRVMLQTTHPSWLYQIEKGATTIWETWEGYTEQGNAFSSHNHYAFGAAAAWLVQGVAGIVAASPGYAHIRFAPCIGGGLTHASATIVSPFGKVSSKWRLVGRDLQLHVTVPNGATGEIQCPGGEVIQIGSGDHVCHWLLQAGELTTQTHFAAPPVTMSAIFG